jgi:predicted DNA-binding transcriptional regulator AlpA
MKKFLSDREVADRYGVKPLTIWRWSDKLEGFPKPVKMAGRTTRWRLDELEAWEKSRAVAA